MGSKSFREENRRRREQNAFENLYAYARETKIPNPKRTAERTARMIHGGAGEERSDDTTPAAGERKQSEKVPHFLEDRTKDQLYERAKELDIEGRSQMTKDELIDAIREEQ